jgi:hypothetical protein
MSDDTSTGLIQNSEAPGKLAAALSFIRRGWPVLILHHMTGAGTELAACSCGDGSPSHLESSAGKHPVAGNWRQAAITDEAIITSVLAGRPETNLGILTGVRAGIWVLDVDPKHQGDKRLFELENEHGKLPYTYTVRTGSGGLHYYWSLPDDFVPSNSSGALPAGLDVRGEGGQVVAPGSVSGVGGYEVLLDLPLAKAPAWLLELIRPKMPSEKVVPVPDDQLETFLTGMMNPTSRLMSYAVSAANQELARLRDAVPGTRGRTAYEVACSLIELANSPWAHLTGERLWAAYLQATAVAMAHGGAFDETEAYKSWESAARKVGTRGRPVPDVPAGGVVVGWELLGGVPPFSPGPGTLGRAGSTESPSSGVYGYRGDSHGFPPFPQDQSSANAPGVTPVDLFPPGFPPVPNDQIAGGDGAAQPVDPVEALISRFITGKALAQMPPPQWLIKDWVVSDSACWVIGKGNDGKSFVALDMAMHVALGRSWRGQRVRKGRVGYMVAEGAAGMGQRYVAWCKEFNDGQDVDDVFFLPMPIQASDMAGWDLFVMAVARMGLDLVILDTQARTTVGMDENSAKEMGLFVEQVERLRRATRATVMVVHHTGKAGATARGSGALYGAAQTELTVSRVAEVVTITVTKQKDAERVEPMTLALKSVVVGSIAGTTTGWVSTPEEPLTAGVLVDVDAAQAGEWAGLSAKAKLLKVLTDIFPDRGALKSEARGRCKEKGLSDTSFYRAWDACLGEGLISKVVVDDRPTERYVSTPLSQRAIPHQRETPSSER